MVRSHKNRPWKRILGSASGFTLVEALVAIAIVTAMSGVISGSFFQALSIQRLWHDDVIATKEWRHAGSRFAGDVLNAYTVNLVDGAPPVNSVALTSVAGGAFHTSTYSVSNGVLVRTFDGAPIELARDVVSASFSRSGRVVTFALTVNAEEGGTDTMNLNTYLRTSP